MCELKFASWTTEVSRVGGGGTSPQFTTYFQINMSIGDIPKEEILSLYSPSGDKKM
jgi:hypothetical protein